MHALFSKSTDSSISSQIEKERKEQKELDKMLEALDMKKPERPVDPRLKSSLNPDYDPHSNKPSKEQLEEFYKYIEKTVSSGWIQDGNRSLIK